MEEVLKFLINFFNSGITEAEMKILASSSPKQMRMMVKQMLVVVQDDNEKSKATKRHGRRSPQTTRGVNAPAPPELALQKEGKLVSPANPVISNVKPAEPMEPPPVTLHASGVAKEMSKVNGAHPAPDELAPATKADPGRMRKRMRLDTPASPVESSTDDSVPPTVDPIQPVLGELGKKTVQNLTAKKEQRKKVSENIRKSVVATK